MTSSYDDIDDLALASARACLDRIEMDGAVHVSSLAQVIGDALRRSMRPEKRMPWATGGDVMSATNALVGAPRSRDFVVDVNAMRAERDAMVEKIRDSLMRRRAVNEEIAATFVAKGNVMGISTN